MVAGGGLQSPQALGDELPESPPGFFEEEGTVWWHAHSDFDRATVHGAIVVHPKRGSAYPYTKPHKEMPIILGTSMDHLDFQYCYGLHACYDDW